MNFKVPANLNQSGILRFCNCVSFNYFARLILPFACLRLSNYQQYGSNGRTAPWFLEHGTMPEKLWDPVPEQSEGKWELAAASFHSHDISSDLHGNVKPLSRRMEPCWTRSRSCPVVTGLLSTSGDSHTKVI